MGVRDLGGGGGSMIFEKMGASYSQVYKPKKGGGPGRGPTLYSMVKHLQREPKSLCVCGGGGSGHPRPPSPPWIRPWTSLHPRP